MILVHANAYLKLEDDDAIRDTLERADVDPSNIRLDIVNSKEAKNDRHCMQ